MSLLIQPIPAIDLVHPANANELALEEMLDALDPLRHYFTRTNGSCSNNNTAGVLDHNLVPLQSSSTIKQIKEFSFGAAADKTLASSNTSTPQLRSPGPVVSIYLSVDASPGCGGIAWPAGEVRFSMTFFSISCV
jgi:protein N-lysine methyltransferase METTL21A